MARGFPRKAIRKSVRKKIEREGFPSRAIREPVRSQVTGSTTTTRRRQVGGTGGGGTTATAAPATTFSTTTGGTPSFGGSVSQAPPIDTTGGFPIEAIRPGLRDVTVSKQLTPAEQIEQDIKNQGLFPFLIKQIPGALSMYTAAAPIEGIFSATLNKLGIGRGAGLSPVVPATGAKAAKTTSRIASNAVNHRLSQDLIGRTANLLGVKRSTAKLIYGTLGTYAWGEWSQTEARESMVFGMKAAMATGDAELIRFAKQEQEEFTNPPLWQSLGRFVPGVSLGVGFWRKFEALALQFKINSVAADLEIDRIENGETFEDKRVKERVLEEESDKRAVDYFNEQAKIYKEWAIEAQAAANKAERGEQRRALEKSAELWAAHAANQRVLEAEERLKIAEFWIEYRKTIMKMYEESRGSQLGFGLFR